MIKCSSFTKFDFSKHLSSWRIKEWGHKAAEILLHHLPGKTIAKACLVEITNVRFSLVNSVFRLCSIIRHHLGEVFHFTACLQFNKIGLDEKINTLVIVLCSEAGECKLVTLETSRTVILPPKVSRYTLMILHTAWLFNTT